MHCALFIRPRVYTFWDYFRSAFARDAGLRIDHLLLSPSLAGRLEGAEVDSGVRVGRKRAIMLRRRLSLRCHQYCRSRARNRSGCVPII
jgi:hypothetical protein